MLYGKSVVIGLACSGISYLRLHPPSWWEPSMRKIDYPDDDELVTKSEAMRIFLESIIL